MWFYHFQHSVTLCVWGVLSLSFLSIISSLTSVRPSVLQPTAQLQRQFLAPGSGSAATLKPQPALLLPGSVPHPIPEPNRIHSKREMVKRADLPNVVVGDELTKSERERNREIEESVSLPA